LLQSAMTKLKTTLQLSRLNTEQDSCQILL
jgi:hypothetical protein